MKHTIKKLLAISLAMLMLACVVGCNGATTSSTPANNPSDTSSDTVSDVSSVDNNDKAEDVSSNTSSNKKPSTQTSSNDEQDEPTEKDMTDKPYTGDNAAALNNKQTSKNDSQANTMRKAILNSKDSGLKGTKTYYVSYKGDDTNDGTSPDKAIKTLGMLNSMAGSMPKNSVVLFERGGVYRGQLKLKSNTSYGAYGTGVKPCIYGSSQNYADESLWTKKKAGVWEIYLYNEKTDVGQIVFDHGVKVSGRAHAATAEGAYKHAFNKSTGILTLYGPTENPGKLYDSIEICNTLNAIEGVRVSNITIENLTVKYAGIHGISFAISENIVVRNCEVGYIGGAKKSANGTPLGNGIEFWTTCTNVTVEDCWVYQCFDAGITHQDTNKNTVQSGVTFKDNLIEYCIYGIEYFVASNSGKIKDTIYTGNMIRFTGMGWSSPHTRTGETYDNNAIAAINGWGQKNYWKYLCENFVIENNIFDTSYKYLINLGCEDDVTIRNNTYYQKKSTTAAVCIDKSGKILKAESVEKMLEAAKLFDSSPKVELD